MPSTSPDVHKLNSDKLTIPTSQVGMVNLSPKSDKALLQLFKMI